MNRTGKPLTALQTKTFANMGIVTKQLVDAWLAQVDSSVYVLPSGAPDDKTNYGLYWIKFSIGQDANGNTIYSQPERALNKAMDVRPTDGFPVSVYRSPRSGYWVIDSANYEAAIRGGFDTRQLNHNDPRKSQITLRQIRNGRGYSPTTSTATGTTISVESLFYQWEGTLKNALKSNSIELSSSIPTAGNERLTLVAMRAYDSTIQTIDGTTRTLSTAKYALSDTDELIGALDDYTIPIAAYRLSDAQAVIDDSDLSFDARQFVNVPPPRGWPYRIKRHTRLLADYQAVVSERQIINAGGALCIDADADYRINAA